MFRAKTSVINLNEISELIIGLKERDIPFTFRTLNGGVQVLCEGWDAICGPYTYGGTEGLIEVMGLCDEDGNDSDVIGHLTAKDIFYLLSIQ